jgi:hypothetical protein
LIIIKSRLIIINRLITKAATVRSVIANSDVSISEATQFVYLLALPWSERKPQNSGRYIAKIMYVYFFGLLLLVFAHDTYEVHAKGFTGDAAKASTYYLYGVIELLMLCKAVCA